MLNFLFSRFPSLEIMVRQLFYSDYLNGFLKKYSKKVKQKSQKAISEKIEFNEVISYLDNLSIKEGDILIVHSSYRELSKYNIQPLELLKYLKNLVGNTGTLVLPAFPVLNNHSFTNKQSSKVERVYDLKSKICSTGLLPSFFLRMPNVLRSEFPTNTLSALGPEAELMFDNNLQTDLAHGVGSAWHYCSERGAKILLLGVDPSKTLTMVHVAEDMLDKKWPISDWYENRDITIKYEDSIKVFNVRTRKQYWSRYMASEYRTRWLKRNKILVDQNIRSLRVGFIANSKELVEKIITNMNLKQNLFFRPPSKYWKKYND